MLPGWYGFGAAVESWGGLIDELRDMYRQWPFFRSVLSNMDMVLAKTDLAIASRYAELVSDKKLRREIFKRIRRNGSAGCACHHHGQCRAPGRQSDSRALDPQPLPLPRSAQPRAGRAPPRRYRAKGVTSGCCA